MKTLTEVLLFSKYVEKANCMRPALLQLGVTKPADLDNLPRYLPKLCGEDIYQVVAELRKVWQEI